MRSLEKTATDLNQIMEMAEQSLFGLTRDKLFPTFFNKSYPQCNIVKTDDKNYYIEMAVAGYTKDELDINYLPDSHVIEITGERRKETEDKRVNYLHKGLEHQKFYQTFNVGEDVEITDAALVNGMLRINIEKVKVEEPTKKIEVKEYDE